MTDRPPSAGTALAGLLLAAGGGRRFGQPKALVEYAGQPLVDRAVQLLRTAGCAPVLVVVGAAGEQVAARARATGAVPVPNPDWASGMASSLRTGLTELQQRWPRVEAAVVLLVDQPALTAEAVTRVAAAHRSGASVAVADYGDRSGHPVLLARTVWSRVLATAVGDQGARAFLAAHPELVTAVDCTGAGSPLDVDRPGDLERF